MQHTINSLVDLSEARHFDIEDIPWSLGVDHSKKWMPDSLLPLNYLPSFQKLPQEEQLLLNQYYASGICEKFIFFESALCVSLKELLKKPERLDPELIPLMKIFNEEEEKHSAMFQRLQNTAYPEKYKGGEYFFINNSLKHWLFSNVIFKNPNFFKIWLWLGSYFEEKTVVFSQEYIKNRKTLDPLFFQVHRYHLLDEARHVEIDRLFFKEFFDSASRFERKVAYKMLVSILESLEVPKVTLNAIFTEVKKSTKVQNPEIYNQIYSEIDMLKSATEYRRLLFGKKRFPVFQSIAKSYPDFAMINEHFCD